MLKNYLVLSFRSLWKHRSATFINVMGLATGLACCIVVMLYFQRELSFDKGFDNRDDIYRVTSSFQGDFSAPTVGLPYAKYLKAEVPEVEDVARMDPTVGSVVVQVHPGSTPYIQDSGYWVDPNFFNLLSFHFLYGDRKTAFKAPNTIVLSQSLAHKLFKDTYPVGKTLRAGGATYTVTGVFKEDFPNHIQADFFASNNSDPIRQQMANNNSWVVNDNFYTYVRLKHGSDVKHVIAELNAYLQRHAGPELKAHGDHITNSLQALKDIHLNSSEYMDYLAYKQGNIKYLFLLGSIALAILLLACINYMNLATAQGLHRVREVGLRRVLGAGKAAIRSQFLTETVVVSFAAFIISIGLSLLFLPEFNQLTGQHLSLLTDGNYITILLLVAATLITGFAAGLYPAFYLSAFNPVAVLKGKIIAPVGTFNIRKMLITSQFIISTCLVFATIVIWKQLHFMLNTKSGFDQEQQLVLNLNGDHAHRNSVFLAQRLSDNVNFKLVSAASAPLISGDMDLYWSKRSINNKQSVFFDFADPNYLKTLGLKLMYGRNFNPETFTNTNLLEDPELHDFGKEVILNEEAAKSLGMDPAKAVGEFVSHLHNGVVYSYRVAGIVKNYHYFSLHAAIGPCAIMNVNPIRCTTIIGKIDGRHASQAVSYASDQWKKINPDTPFTYGFLNDIFQSDYVQDQRLRQMTGIFAVMAIFISCLGLLALITYNLGQKAREIGIRKVIGASVGSIVVLFYKQYFKLVILANIVALPLAWYIMNAWLRSFPYRVTISWWIYGLSLTCGVLIAFCTIAFKTVKAAMVNPAESLRAE
ncbi:MAG TPA: ABC transporter permease [Mucilaginibacter sp.]|nr:ABC transporter permease [Mucilaginibacter sp.]